MLIFFVSGPGDQLDRCTVAVAGNPNSFGKECKPIHSLCTHASHLTNKKILIFMSRKGERRQQKPTASYPKSKYDYLNGG